MQLSHHNSRPDLLKKSYERNYPVNRAVFFYIDDELQFEQYKKHGLLKFLALYLWYSMKYGYYNNPFEVEAREKEKELPDGSSLKI